MSVYPTSLDSDQTIIRVDDNITEIGGDAINQLRDAVFAIEKELGIGLSGSVSTLANRIDISFNANGTIKSSALTSVGLATLPIVDNQVANNAGIKEFKLSLDHTTSDLYTLVISNATIISSVQAFAGITDANFNAHLAGATFLTDGETSARHVASQIDLNKVPTDSRDSFFTWSGLKDKNGSIRSGTNVGSALLQINDDLVSHENAIADAHVASAINVDTSNFVEIPSTATTVQKVIDYLNDAEELNIGQHRATQHSNGVPPHARANSLFLDGYGDAIVPPTPVTTYLVHPPANYPLDSNTVGDDIIRFVPDNTSFIFDSQFSQVRVGDIIRVNYGNSIETSFNIESIRYLPGTEWVVRINGINLFDGYVLARIDRPLFDTNTAGVLAVASANVTPFNLYPNILGSLIVGHPHGASAIGLNFDPNELDSTHYNLYLELYPTGNPVDKILTLPAIDVTGNAGITPGVYTLNTVINSTNDNLRRIGYNYRFIAFDFGGDFGIMLADPIGKAGFAILNGSNSSGTLVSTGFPNNVIDDVSSNTSDALGLGKTRAAIASPTYQTTFSDFTAAQLPTKIILPKKQRNYIVNGRRRDDFAATYLATSDGYWNATITNKVSTGSSVEVTYKIELDLSPARLKPGKTLVIQPTISFDDVKYTDNDYGRFIIKSVAFIAPCGSIAASTDITVINGVHATGNPLSFVSAPGLEVKIYFSEDSVGFNQSNLIDPSVAVTNYHRLHEIYVNEFGTTFSHERGRMPIQNETTNLLRTDYWHIKNISPKLRGYKDNSTTFNKYVRFYITSYDSTSGEFDGYLGQRVPSNNNIINSGPIVSGRKGTPVRFYDETSNDYIELEFVEISTSPGIAILSDSTARYVDIELFSSLQLNDENLFLATCEVNWDPPTNQDIIQNVVNRKQFGSINEIDFTQSAIDFISTGDRLLHENGVIRGFDFVSVNSTDNRELSFLGGVALVNGTITSTNNATVFIPQISQNGTVPSDVTWAVCVNEFGYLKPIFLTDTKSQIFAQASKYFIESVTFDELVNNRKDLTPIAVVVAHIASITISNEDVSDARRFVASEALALPLTWTNSSRTGNFKSIDAIKSWVNNLSGTKNVIKINGTFDISNTPLDLTGFENKTIFDGEGAIFNITGSDGLLVGNNLILRNISLNYNPTGLTFTTGDKINLGNAAILGTGSLSNISIESCSFVKENSEIQRPPFINFLLSKGDILDNLTIKDNVFNDNDATNLMAAIAIINKNDGISAEPAVLANTLIFNNICNKNQGIHLLTASNTSTVTAPGLSMNNVRVEENNCGVIGYGVSGTQNMTTSFFGSNRNQGLIISKNTCHLIGALNELGNSLTEVSRGIDYTYPTGNVSIIGNFCNWITAVQKTINARNVSVYNIKDNNLEAWDSSWVDNNFFGGDVLGSVGIYQLSQGISDLSKVNIINNSLNDGYFSGTDYSYTKYGILITSSALIEGNIVGGLGTNSTGLFVNSPTGSFANYEIINNKFYRNGNTIVAYIEGPGNGNDQINITGIIINNFFDSNEVSSF